MKNTNFKEELLVTNYIPKKLNMISLKYRDLLIQDIKNKKIKTEEVSKCICCGSKHLEKLSNIDRFGLPFGSLICKDCGLISTSPRLHADSLPYYYNKYYHPLNFGVEHIKVRNALFNDGQGKKIFNIVKSNLPEKKELTVLEIGAGTGSVLQEFKQEALKYNITIKELGTEYSLECISECRKRNINIIQGNIQTVSERKEKYDVIILSHVFEHFIDLTKELGELQALMHPSSILYIEVPGLLVNHKKPYYKFSYLIYHVHAHMYNFRQETLTNILIQNGFKEISGNQEVENIYKLSLDKKNIPSYHNIYNDTIKYLEFLHNNYEYFNKEYNDKVFYERQYKQQIVTIENREKTIKQKNEALKKRDEIINQKNEALKKRDEIIDQKNEALKKRDEIIDQKNEALKKQNLLIEKLNKEKLTIMNILQKFHSFNIILNPIKKIKSYRKLMELIHVNKD